MSEGDTKPPVVQEAHQVDTYHVPKAFFEYQTPLQNPPPRPRPLQVHVQRVHRKAKAVLGNPGPQGALLVPALPHRPLRLPRRRRQRLVPRGPPQRLLQLRRPPRRKDPRQASHHLRGRRARRGLHPHLQPAHARRLPAGLGPQGDGRPQGRRRRNLPAHDPRGHHRLPRLQPHRRRPHGRLRRLLRRLPPRPHHRRRGQGRAHLRRGQARRQDHRHQEDRRRRPQKLPRRHPLPRLQADRQGRADEGGPRQVVDRGDGEVARLLPPGEHVLRGPPLPALHLWLHRQAQGRHAHHRRLPARGRADGQVRLRHAGERHLLLRRRRRLDHRTHIRRLLTTRAGRDHRRVRGHARLPRLLPLLGGHREAQGDAVLRRPDGAAPAEACGRRTRQPGDEAPARARLRRRAHRGRGLEVVSRDCGKDAGTHCRHVLADRDRLAHHHAPGRHHPDEAGLVLAPLLRHRARDHRPRLGRGAARQRRRGRARHQAALAVHDPHRLRQPQALHGHLPERVQGLLLHRRWRRPRPRGLLLDPRPRRRRGQRVRPPPVHGRDRGRPDREPQRGRGGRRRRQRRADRPGRPGLCRAQGRVVQVAAGHEEGAHPAGPQEHRPLRRPEADLDRPGPAQDAVRQDHEADHAEDSERRGRSAGGHEHSLGPQRCRQDHRDRQRRQQVGERCVAALALAQ